MHCNVAAKGTGNKPGSIQTVRCRWLIGGCCKRSTFFDSFRSKSSLRTCPCTAWTSMKILSRGSKISPPGTKYWETSSSSNAKWDHTCIQFTLAEKSQTEARVKSEKGTCNADLIETLSDKVTLHHEQQINSPERELTTVY